ncbi:hypothetical protein VTN77DRAFT_1421 [Rasamsonia byssochlamydoides]|uniref:uncharacterized protein n=1 Tax=Rasamsonia byssochlamydoides TaxID=89139 RepID=UPI0037437032
MASSTSKAVSGPSPGSTSSKQNDGPTVADLPGTTRASTLGLSASTRSQRFQSNLRRAHTVGQTGVTGKKTVTNRGRRDLTASLLRVKNSTEVLRQRSLKRSNAPLAVDVPSSGREGTHFTVGNVGNNGRIYLRPMIDSPKRAHTQPLHSSSMSVSTNTHLQPPKPVAVRGARHSTWSASQLSDPHPDYIREESAESSDSSDAEHQHKRAHSFTTVEEHAQSTGQKHRGEFRIVIDRPESKDKPSGPALEVPIPHYRLGTPQFNPDGIPVLRSSVYTRTSISDNVRSSVLLKEDAGSFQSPSDSHAQDSLQPGQTISVAMSMFSGAANRNSSSSQKSAIYSLKGPIEPSIFDFLMDDMDDPAVVRYLPGTKDISAATPARIVAQISSESFMDYELVSDFFLTFRSYLSTENLLALLMARLEWAINRLQDDGRIIRIRTFAALRHWILNYFVDDFVINRDLRVQFCDKINSLYERVKGRDTAGTSDIKILVDLKRCWHGRCSLYWDCPDLAGPDSPVVPGGVAGSRDISKTTLSEIDTPNPDVVVDADLGDNQTEHPPPPADATRAEQLPHSSTTHMRNVSSGTARSLPMSDQSVEAVSCSFPAKRSSLPLERSKVPHPIPVQTQFSSNSSHPCSPIVPSFRRYPLHEHKRSGSFSDSVRDDRSPLSRANMDGYGQLPFQSTSASSSLIRGNLLPPADAFVGILSPPSPTLFAPSDELEGLNARSSSEGNGKPLGASPGVRTIIGSLRRAFHSRPGGHGAPSHTGNANSAHSLRGKTATLPVNVAFGSDIYRDRKTSSLSRSSSRIDVLCDQAMRDYREALGLRLEKPTHPHDITLLPQENAGQDLKSESDPRRLHVPEPDHQRLPSQVTSGSKSIVIVDDTGLDLPVMSGGVPWPPASSNGIDREQGNSEQSSITQKDHSFSEVPVAFPGRPMSLSSRPPTRHPSQSYASSRGASIRRSTHSIASRLRKYASYNSGISRMVTSVSSDNLPEDRDRPLARMLRRRPGGDLRKIQHVHDLEPHSRPQSFVSDTSLTDSITTSAAPYPGPTSHPRVASTRYSLINTHSSQHMRPSFEAVVADLSRIPDDEDGGIESTLLKLEGKWPKSSRSDMNNHLVGHDGDSQQHQYETLGQTAGDTNGAQVLVGQRRVTSQLYSESVAESEYSYSSIPLLERGLSDDSMKKPKPTSLPSETAMPRPLFSGDVSKECKEPESSHPSIQIVDETESLRRIPPGSTIPASADFENRDRLSDLSSELSVDVIEKDEAFEDLSSRRTSRESRSLRISSLDIPPHPLAHPPSPPMTIQRTVSIAPYAKPKTPVPTQAQPPTPGPSPTRKNGGSPHKGVETQQVSKDMAPIQDQPQLGHVPFILACDSRVLAQQLTLVEKAALDEVDWRDLVEMKWNNTSSSALNWVQFLTEKERKGIDLVVGRFNLMVKWVLSEIVLTRDIHERAQTVTKFIHVAAHARRICNYSTMLQIAIALSSVDCTRLQKTWALVSPADKHLLKGMESLIQPVRNFHELRVEMETANLQDGCIPFVGLYVHDLTYNAQKPSQVAGTRDGDVLVNFERYRTAARIVKCLLRLIDASNKYTLEPVPGVIERCLWIASLSEEKIQALSKSLE